jgi:TorA maturation chaperone TorD/DNA-binding transcriptional regulator YdaS (Cro superfamily)
MPRDGGLEQAIEAAGGVGALARTLGIAQPSVSAWNRIPAERVLAIEAATGIARSILRPDLYPESVRPTGASAVDEVDRLRGHEYGLLALVLGRAPNAETLAKVAALQGDASPLGLAHIALAEAASAAGAEAVASEYFALFIGLGRGELLPFASYYLTGFLHERPLARVREDLSGLGLVRDASMAEPEDHIAILCETMAGLASGRFAAAAGADRRFFERHLEPWAPRFFADLEAARAGRFYRAVGKVGRLFLDIESEAFRLTD